MFAPSKIRLRLQNRVLVHTLKREHEVKEIVNQQLESNLIRIAEVHGKKAWTMVL